MPTLEEKSVRLRLQPGTQSGSRHRVSGRGIEVMKRGTARAAISSFASSLIFPPLSPTSSARRSNTSQSVHRKPRAQTVYDECIMNMRTSQQAVYVISVAAELAGMHPQTLRIYSGAVLSNLLVPMAAIDGTATMTLSCCVASQNSSMRE